MKDFRCSCKGCGRTPGFGAAEIWFESEGGMLCEACWKRAVREGGPPPPEEGPKEGEFCCFCALCKRTPPDPEFKIWIETDKGCVCEKCWKETIGSLVAGRIESILLERKPKESEPLDVQLGCCLLNKKLLNKALDALQNGNSVEVLAENSEDMKAHVRKYVEAKGCVIAGVDDRNGTSVITIRRP